MGEQKVVITHDSCVVVSLGPDDFLLLDGVVVYVLLTYCTWLLNLRGWDRVTYGFLLCCRERGFVGVRVGVGFEIERGSWCAWVFRK